MGPSSSTVWGGTAFDCEGNMITLRHRINDTAAGQCRSIVGKIVKVNHFTGEFTSQLTINYYPELFGKTIECFQNYNNGSDEILVGSLLITKPGSYYNIIICNVHSFINKFNFLLKAHCHHPTHCF